MQFRSVNHTLVARICKTNRSSKTSRVDRGVQGKSSIYYVLKSIKCFWITFHTSKHYISTLLPVILRLFIKNGPHRWTVNCISTVNFKWLHGVEFHSFRDALSSRGPFLATKSPSKMMRNVFYFTLKALLILKIFKFFVMNFRSCQKAAWLEI